VTGLPIHDPVQIFALVMLVILVVPVGCRGMRLPAAFGLIMAGVVLGPHALDVLERDATMRLLGTVGLLYIMFQVGLEIDLHQFRRHRSHSLVFGTLTFAIPMALGIAAAMLVLGMDVAPAILLGSVFASHTLLTFPTVSRLGLVKTRVVSATVGGTVIADSAALLVLAAIAASTHGSTGVGYWLRFVGLAAATTGLIVWGLPRLGRWFFRTAATDDTVEYVFTLAAVFSCAVLLQAAGLEAIIGALLAGLALNRLIPENGVLMNRVRFAGNALFIPFFLISIGMLVNLRLPFESREAAVAALVLTGVALVTKWVSAAICRRVLGYDRNEGGLMLGLSVSRAAAALAVVMVGFELALFSEAIVTGAVVMILGTCSVGAWLTDRYAQRHAQYRAQQPTAMAAPTDRIMVPLANPSTADRLMGLALLLRRSGSHEPIYPLAVVPESPQGTAIAVAEAEHMLGRVVVHAVAAQVPVFPVTRVDMNVATGICRAMADFRASVAIIGWRGEVSSL
jgi:Kef-type K+ transport system membrane component KefB